MQTPHSSNPHNLPTAQPSEQDPQAARAASLRELAQSYTGPLNPLFCDWVPADFDNPENPFVCEIGPDSDGAPSARLDGISLASQAMVSALSANHRLAFEPPENIERYIFTSNLGRLVQPLPAQNTVALSREGLSGFYIKDGKILPDDCGLALQCGVVPFVSREGMEWNIGDAARFAQPFKFHRDAAIFPLVGEMYAHGREISDDLLERLGFGMAGMPKPPAAPGEAPGVQAVNYPLFYSGGRSVLVPCSMPIFVRPTPEGGSEFAGQEIIDSQGKAIESLHSIPAIAFQFIGIGTRRYIYHAAARDNGAVALSADEVVLHWSGEPANDSFRIVQRGAYAGRSGIFLDLRHQPGADAPTGALTNAKRSYELDALLWRHGARMGGVVLAYAPLLRDSDLQEIFGSGSDTRPNELQVAIRAIFDDTHRLDTLCGREEFGIGEHHTRAVQHIVARDRGKFDAETRDAFLVQAADNLGHNLKVSLSLGLVIPKDQPTSDNLSVYGKLLDSENFVQASNRYQLLPLVRAWFNDLRRLSEASGVAPADFGCSAASKAFFTAWLGSQHADQLIEAYTKERADLWNQFAPTAAAVAWIKDGLAREGLALGYQQLAQHHLRIMGSLGDAFPAQERELLEDLARGLKAPIYRAVYDLSSGAMQQQEAVAPQQYADEVLLPLYIRWAIGECAIRRRDQPAPSIDLIPEMRASPTGV